MRIALSTSTCRPAEGARNDFDCGEALNPPVALSNMFFLSRTTPPPATTIGRRRRLRKDDNNNNDDDNDNDNDNEWLIEFHGCRRRNKCSAPQPVTEALGKPLARAKMAAPRSLSAAFAQFSIPFVLPLGRRQQLAPKVFWKAGPSDRLPPADRSGLWELLITRPPDKLVARLVASQLANQASERDQQVARSLLLLFLPLIEGFLFKFPEVHTLQDYFVSLRPLVEVARRSGWPDDQVG